MFIITILKDSRKVSRIRNYVSKWIYISISRYKKLLIFGKKLSILKNFRVIKICMTNIVIYLYFLLTSYNQKLRNFLVEDIRTFLRKNLALDLTFDILPFRIYNHCFSCDRGSYLNNRCNLCSKFFIRDKKISIF